MILEPTRIGDQGLWNQSVVKHNIFDTCIKGGNIYIYIYTRNTRTHAHTHTHTHTHVYIYLFFQEITINHVALSCVEKFVQGLTSPQSAMLFGVFSRKFLKLSKLVPFFLNS